MTKKPPARPPKKGTAKKLASKKPGAKKISVSLPTALSTPLESMGDYAWLIYGGPGMGKTTLAGQFPDTFFMMFEPGGKAYELYQQPVIDWREASAFVDLLNGPDGQRFSTVAVDVVEIAYQMCMEWCVTNKFGGLHPQEMNDRGKSWSDVRHEFAAFIVALMNLPQGLIFLSHVRDEKIQRRDGTEYDTVRPNVTGQAWGVIEGLMDFVIHYGMKPDGSGRELIVRPDGYVNAKTRVKHMLHTTTGKPIHSIDAGTTEEEAFASLSSAWNGQTEYQLSDGSDIKPPAPPKRKGPKVAKKRPPKN